MSMKSRDNPPKVNKRLENGSKTAQKRLESGPKSSSIITANTFGVELNRHNQVNGYNRGYNRSTLRSNLIDH